MAKNLRNEHDTMHDAMVNGRVTASDDAVHIHECNNKQCVTVICSRSSKRMSITRQCVISNAFEIIVNADAWRLCGRKKVEVFRYVPIGVSDT